MIKTIDVWFIVCFIAFWFEVNAMNLFFCVDVLLRTLNNVCCTSNIRCGALDWWWHFGYETLVKLWSYKVSFFVMYVYKAMTLYYVSQGALMETLGILWKANWLGMATMLCLLACHEVKVSAWTSMLLIVKPVLPTC